MEITYREIRKKMGKTQKEMAEIFGISRSYYGLIENYQRPLKTTKFLEMCRMADVNPYDVKISL